MVVCYDSVGQRYTGLSKQTKALEAAGKYIQDVAFE